MTAISPGDEVTVTITGTVESIAGRAGAQSYWFGLVTPDGRRFGGLPNRDPAVKVTVLRPDRPTRREVLEDHHGWTSLMLGTVWCVCGDRIADEMRAGQAAWISHLDAVLTKWEDS